MKNPLTELLKALAKLEFQTEAGRVNIGVMLLILVCVLVTSVTPLAEALIKLLKDDYQGAGVPVGQIFAAFIFLGVACVFMIGMLEVWASSQPDTRRTRSPRSVGRVDESSADEEDN